MTYGARLQLAMDEAKVDRKTLASNLRITVQALGQVLGGKTKALDALHHTKAALYLHCDPLWLAAGGRRSAAPYAPQGVEEERAPYGPLPAGLRTIERDIVLSVRELPKRRQTEIHEAVMAEARQYIADMRELAERHGTHSTVTPERAAETLPMRPDGPQLDTVPGTIE
jgi:hypothetical protein